MRWGPAITVSVVLIVCTATVIGYLEGWHRHTEPTFKGMPASYWIALTDDNSIDVRREAFNALATMPRHPAARTKLMAGMQDSDAAIRLTSILALQDTDVGRHNLKAFVSSQPLLGPWGIRDALDKADPKHRAEVIAILEKRVAAERNPTKRSILEEDLKVIRGDRFGH